MGARDAAVRMSGAAMKKAPIEQCVCIYAHIHIHIYIWVVCICIICIYIYIIHDMHLQGNLHVRVVSKVLVKKGPLRIHFLKKGILTKQGS